MNSFYIVGSYITSLRNLFETKSDLDKGHVYSSTTTRVSYTHIFNTSDRHNMHLTSYTISHCHVAVTQNSDAKFHFYIRECGDDQKCTNKPSFTVQQQLFFEGIVQLFKPYAYA